MAAEPNEPDALFTLLATVLDAELETALGRIAEDLAGLNDPDQICQRFKFETRQIEARARRRIYAALDAAKDD